MLNENGQKVDSSRNILAEIAEKTQERIDERKSVVSLDEIKAKAIELAKNTTDKNFAFEKAIGGKDEMSFICEVKKASPSKGLIAPDFDYMQIAKDYEQFGANAISCLTEPYYFMGADEYLRDITSTVNIPVLRKDFFVDEYMIYEAKTLGASAILLICGILDIEQLKHFYSVADSLGLSSIFEVHDETELQMALEAKARIIGINNRNLKTFELDLNTTIDLRNMVDKDIIFISESGIKTRDDIKLLESHNVQAVLIGETLMRDNDKKSALDKLKHDKI